MAIDRKDITLAVKGENRTGSTFSQATKSVRELTDAVKQQVDGVRKGDTALEDLKNTLQELRDVGLTLARQQGLIDTFKGQSAALAGLGTRLDEAKAKAATFAASLEGKTQISKRAEATLLRLNNTVTKTGEQFAAQQAGIANAGAALEAAGIDARDLDGASKSLLATSHQVGASVATLNATMRGYGATMRVVRAEEKASADAAKAKATTIAQVNATLAKATEQQERLMRAVRNAETAAAREQAENEKATRAQTNALLDQSDAVYKLTNSYSALRSSNIALARVRGAGGAERAVQGAVSPTIGQGNLAVVSQTVTALGSAVSENAGKPVQNYLGLLQDLERSLKSVQNVAKQVDGYQAQRAATLASMEAFKRTREELRTLNAAFNLTPTKENAAAVQAALPAYQRATAAFREQLAQLRVMREELKQAGVSTRDFGATQTQLVDLTRRTSAAIRDLNNNYEKFGGSRREGNAGFLGLRPYEIQNLGFQINDFFTQLASGTSVTQAFSQQIGQVAQITPVWTRIVAFAPAFISLGAAIGVTTAALARLFETAASNRSFEATLTLLTGGDTSRRVGVTAEQLTRMARTMEALGLSFEDARKAAAAFLQEGVTPATLEAATEAALRYARATGKEATDGVKLLTDALRGGNSAVIALREAGISLDDQQRQAIIAAQNATSEYERQQQVLAVLTPIIRAADEQGLSPLTRAINSAKEAWRGLLDELGRTTAFTLLESAINTVISGLGNMGRVGALVARSLQAAFSPVYYLLDTIRRTLGALGRTVDEGPPIAVGADGQPTTGAGGGSSAGPGTSPIGGDNAAELAAQREATKRELEIIRDDQRRNRRDRETAALRLARIEVDAANQGASAQTRAYLAQLKLVEFRQKLDEEARRGAGAAAAETRRDFAAINTDLQNVIRTRDENIRGIQEDVVAGATTPAEAIRKIGEAAAQARPEIQRLRDEAQRFLDSGRGGNDAVRNSAIQRVIATADRQLTGETGSRTGTNAVLQQSSQEVQRLIQDRQQFAQTQNALAQQGAITQYEAQTAIQGYWQQTEDRIRSTIDAYGEASTAAAANGQITQTAAQQNAAQVQLWRTQLEYVNPQMTALRNSITQGFTGAFTTAVDAAGQSIGNLLAGVQDLSTTFDDLGRAALQFLADFLKSIAQAIAQTQALIIVQAILKAVSSGAPGGAGVKTAHTGTVVGSPGGVVRSGVNPAIFANAPRMHGGEVVGGLRSDERAAILQTGEEVLARDNPRNIRNMGQGASGPAATGSGDKTILAIGDSEIANAMNSAPGERVMLAVLKRNATTLRSLVRG